MLAQVERRYKRICYVIRRAKKAERPPESWREAYGELYSLAELCASRFSEELKAGDVKAALAFLEYFVKLVRLAFEARREFEFDEAMRILGRLEGGRDA